MRFRLNIGAAVKSSLDEARTLLFDLIQGIENDRRVTFELGREVGTPPPPGRDADRADRRHCR